MEGAGATINGRLAFFSEKQVTIRVLGASSPAGGRQVMSLSILPCVHSVQNDLRLSKEKSRRKQAIIMRQEEELQVRVGESGAP